MPEDCNRVIINTGHTVTVDIATATASSTTVNGILSFSRVVSSTLTLAGGNITIEAGGTLDMGTAASPIPTGVVAQLVLASGTLSGASYGLIVSTDGNFTAYGSSKSVYGLATADAAAGASAVSLSTADSAGWLAGDQITIGQTSGSPDQTEKRTIASIIIGPSVNTLLLSSPLSFSHSAATAAVVANLTRNVLVISSAPAKPSYVQNLARNTTSFSLVNAEFAFLGLNAAGKYGLTLDGAAVRAAISSCTIHDGYAGLYVNAAASNTISGNVIYKNTGGFGGIYLTNAGGNALNSNLSYSNASTGYGIYLNNASNSLLISNWVYSNTTGGIYLQASSSNTLRSNRAFINSNAGLFLNNSSNNTLAANRAYSNATYGISVQGTSLSSLASGNSLLSNAAFANTQYGLYLVFAASNTLDANAAYANTSRGIYLSAANNNALYANTAYSNGIEGLFLSNSSRNLLVGNASFSNGTEGLEVVVNSNSNRLISNTFYANLSPGVLVGNALDNLLVGGALGFDASGASQPDGTAEVSATGGSVNSNITARNARINTAVAVTSPLNFNVLGSFFLSYGQNSATGTVRLHGDYTVSGSTFTLDYASQLYASTATAPILLRGLQHAATAASTLDDAALDQLISIEYRSGQWHVDGSSSGPDMAVFSGNQTGLAVPSSNAQFTLDFTEGPGPNPGDLLRFALLSASRDANVQKRLLFGGGSSIFRSGFSKLSVAASGGFVLTGTAGYPSVMDRIDNASPYYSFVDSGAFTAQFSSFTNADSLGIQLSGTAGVSLGTSTFDFMGSSNNAAHAYLTARALTSAATFYNVTFGASRSTSSFANAYNVHVEDSDAALNWQFRGESGAMAGEPYNDDPGNKVLWSVAAPSPALPSLTAAQLSSATASWQSVGADNYVVDASTAADFSGAVLSSASVVSSTQPLSPQGLSPNTTYYLRVGALWSGTPSYSAILTTATLASAVSNAQILGPLASSAATVNWTPLPTAAQAGSSSTAEGYRLEASLNANFSPIAVSSATPNASLSTLAVSGLTANTTYYFRVGSLNWGSAPNYIVVGSTIVCPLLTSAGSGRWADPATWNFGVVPTACSGVTVAAGHTVTVDIATATASSTTVSGTLAFSRVNSSSLTISAGSLTVAAGGTLDLGTEASPIPAGVNAQLVLAGRAASAGQYGLIVANGGNFTVRGATKTPFGLASSDALAGATSLLLPAASASGWAVGDELTIGMTNSLATSDENERQTITAITGTDPLTVSWIPPLSYSHAAADGVVVSNLTRNVLVRSSSTARAAYIQDLAQSATSFVLAHGEFAYLGLNSASKFGITLDGAAAAASISSCSIHEGYHGVFLNLASGNSITGNVLYKNAGIGLLLTGATKNLLQGNSVHSNAQHGILLQTSANNNTVASNYAYFNHSTGSDNVGIMVVASSNNTLDSNVVYDNVGRASGQAGYGIYLSNANNNLLNANKAYYNRGQGAGLGYGLYLTVTSNNLLVNNHFYANSSYGLYEDRTSNTVVGGALGYDAAGASRPNGLFETSLHTSGTSNLTFKSARINPLVGVSTAGFFAANNYLLSYNTNYATGTVRLHGDYAVSGSTFTLDYAAQLYASTATAPKLMRGSGHSAAVTATTDANAASQLVTIEYRSGQWHVDGSVSGRDMAAFSGGQTGLAVPSSNTQFTLDFTEGSSPASGDRVDFALVAASKDANVQKRLLVGPSASTFRRGLSKITIAASGGFVLTGAAGYPSILDRLTTSSSYYTFVDSGAFTAQFSSITNTDNLGVQLSGAAGVSIGSTTFDLMGVSDGAVNAYLTARALSSTATFHNVAFNVSRATASASAAYNVRVEGVDSSLSWQFRGESGALAGKSYNDDPNNRVLWSAAAPAPASPAVAGAQLSSVTVSWQGVDADSYRVDASTAADFSGTLFSSASVVSSTQPLSPQGLSPNTTYYLRVGAVWSGATSYSSATVSTVTLSSLVSNAQILDSAVPGAAVLNWNALSSTQATGYRLEASTSANFSPVAASSASAGVSQATLTVSGLNAGATYYFRVGSLNWGGAPNYAVVGSSAASCPSLTSAGSGRWADPAVWDLGVVPASCSGVTIAPGHSISVDITTAAASSATVNGTLSFSRVSSSSLTISAGSLTVAAGGTLDLGTEASPIPAAIRAHLVLAADISSGDPVPAAIRRFGVLASAGNAGRYGLIVANGGNFTVRGATKTPFGFASADVLAGATSLTIPAASASGWAVGDQITIAQAHLASADKTERSTITAISGTDPLTLSWLTPLGFSHYSSNTVLVANLTRNVLVISSFTIQPSYIQNLAQNATSFALAHGEFAYLGQNATSKFGITFDGAGVLGSVSSCSIREGYIGLYLDQASGNTLAGNVIYKNTSNGIHVSNASSTTLRSNAVESNSGTGINLSNASNNALTGNSAYANNTGMTITGGTGNTLTANGVRFNRSTGIFWSQTSSNTATSNTVGNTNGVGFSLSQASDNTLTSNSLGDNATNGISVSQSSGNVLTDNVVYANSSSGLALSGASSRHSKGNLFNGNRVHGNAGNGGFDLQNFASSNTFVLNTSSANRGYGLALFTGAGSNLLVANDFHANNRDGIFAVADGGAMIGNSLYSNSGAGLHLSSASLNVFANGNLGYDPNGTLQPNATAELYVNSSAQSRVIVNTLKNARINPSLGISTAGFNRADRAVLSYGQDYATGTLRLHGDYAVANSTLTLDYAARLFASTATLVLNGRGPGHQMTVATTSDANAVSQLITVQYRSGQWHVDGSVSGADLATFANNQTGLSVPSSNAQFTLNFTHAAAPREGDSLYFGLISATNDANVQKKLLLGPSHNGFRGGQSKLAVAASGGFVLRGTTGIPSLMDRLDASGPYYAFVDSGAFTAAFSSFTNADSLGIQLSGSGGVSLGTSTFDSLGLGTGTANAYLTARALTSAATFYNVAFGVSRSTVGATSAYNAFVTGDDTGLRWSFVSESGALAGLVYAYDPNNRITWSATPQVPPRNPVVAAVGLSSVTLTWQIASGAGGYVIDASTTASNFTGAVTSSATSNPALLTLAPQGLTPNTTYHLRAGALWGSTTSYWETNLTTSTLSSPVANAQILTFISSTAVTWTALPTAAQAGSSSTSEGYRVEASTSANFAPVAFASATPNVSLSTLTFTALEHATYYFRVGSLNWGSVPNYVALGSSSLACPELNSAASGNWSDASTWHLGAVPASCNTVRIQTGHTVILDTAAVASGVTIAGTLSFNRAADSSLSVSLSSVVVTSGGTLDLGTEASPIPASARATLTLAPGPGSGLTIQAGGAFSARGAAKSPFGFGTADAPGGATSLTVAASSAAGWAAGDVLTIGQTARNSTNQTESRTLAAISGSDPKTLSWLDPLTYDHVYSTSTVIVVGNLTRNVRILSSSSSQPGVVQNHASSASGFSAAYAEFSGLNGLDFYGSGSISSSSIHDSKSSALVLNGAGSSVTLTGNHVYNNVLGGGFHPVVDLSSGTGASTLANNAFGSNAIALWVQNNGSVLNGNYVYSNDDAGVVLCGASASRVADNVVFSHSDWGIELTCDEGAELTGTYTRNNVVSGNRVFNNGSIGIYLDGASSNTVSANRVYGNNDVGIELFSYLDNEVNNLLNTIQNNTVYANQGEGIALVDHFSSFFGASYGMLSTNTIVGNVVYGNLYSGILSEGGTNAVTGNTVSSNTGSGILNFGTGDIVSGNTVSANDDNGIEPGDNAVVSNNVVSGNNGIGIVLGKADLVVGNQIYANVSNGIRLGDRSALIGNTIYSNGAPGLDVSGSQGSVAADQALGYNLSGTSKPNATAEITHSNFNSNNLTLKNVRVNPAVGISTAGLNADNGSDYLLSYNQDYDTGTLRIQGDYSLSGAVLTLDYASRLYASTATTPLLMRGLRHSATAYATTNAVSQLVTLQYRSGQWHVDGSSTGADMATFSGSQSGLSVPASNAQFTLYFTQGAGPTEGDRLDFALIAGSNDANVRKKLLFGPSGSSGRGGKSRIQIASNGGLVLRGAAGFPTVVDRLDAGGPYYTLVDSGTFTAQFSSFTNADSLGIQLSGSAGVSIGSSTFDSMGLGSGAVNAYLTARSLTSDATFYSVAFDASRSTAGAASAYNVHVEGGDNGLNWQFRGESGVLSGEAYNDDPRNKVLWSSSTPPPAGVSLSAINLTSAAVNWQGVGALSTVVEAATAADFSGVVFSSVSSANAGPTAPQGLSPNTTYYLRAGALWGTATTYVTVPGAPLSTPANAPTGLQVRLSISSAAANWIPLPTAAQGGSSSTAEGYILEVSSKASFSPLLTSSTTPNVSLSTLSVTSLLNTTLYFRVGALNWNSAASYSAVVSTSVSCPTMTSSGSGNWSSAGTWDAGSVPSACNAVVIAAGHAVTVDVQAAAASTVTVSGTLSFSRVATSSLTLSNGNMTVNAGGTLDLGTGSSPIPAGVNAQLALAAGDAAGQYGLTVSDGGNFTVRGATKTPFGFAAADVPAGAVNLTIPASGAVGWAAGDVITIGMTALNVKPSGSSQGSTDHTESRTISSISGTDPLTLAWSGGLSYPHYASHTVVVGNLTRNVLVQSASPSKAGYIRSLVSNATSFSLVQGEFAYLGANASGKHGITLDGSRGSISSSTVRQGYIGVYLSTAAGNTLSDNLIYANSGGTTFGAGIYLSSASGNTIQSNAVYSNRPYGVYLTQASSNTLRSNTIAASDVYTQSGISFGNIGAGLYLIASVGNTLTANNLHSNTREAIHLLGSSSNTLTSNNAYLNAGNDGTGGGVLLETNSKFNHLSSNNAHANNGAGFYDAAGPTTFSGNNAYSNTGPGFYLTAFADTLAGNSAYSNTTNGIELRGSSAAMVANAVYSNAAVGLYLSSSAGSLFADGRLGYDASQTAAPNGTFELSLDASRAESLTLKGTRLNPSVGLSTAGFNRDGNSLTSYMPDYATGTVRFYGSYALSGSTWTFDHAAPVFASTATNLRLLIGTGHSASVASASDANAVSQLITVQYRSGQWHVDGSVSGADMAAFSGNQSGLSVPSSNAQFSLNFTQGAAPVEGDRLDFVLVAATPDTNVQKRLLFGPGAASFRGGFSQLAVAASGGLVLRGVAASPTLVDRLDAGGRYLTIVDSGAFTAANASLANLDNRGLQLSGSAGVAISSTTFDSIGVVSGTNAYITANGVASTATFSNLTFGLSRSTAGAAAAYNVRVLGADASLNWTFSNAGGALAGAAHDYDPNGRLTWTASTTPPPTAPALAGVQSSSVAVTWGLVGADAYLAQASTAADFSGTLFSSAAPAGVAASTLTPQGLTPNTTYYLRAGALWATTTFYANTTPASTVTLAAVPGAPASTFTLVFASSLTVAWSSGTAADGYNPNGTLYEARISTMAGFVPLWASSSTYNLSSTFTSLSPATTFYAQVRAINAGGTATSFASLGSTATLPGFLGISTASYTGASTGTVSLTWSANFAPGTLYTATVSTGALPNAFTGNVASATANLSASLSGLSPNTSYYASVSTSATGPFTTLGSTMTPAVAPGSAAASTFTSVSASGLTLNWSSGTAAGGYNPSGTTLYQARISTMASLTPVLDSSTTYNLSAAFTGLGQATTYYAQVRALNGDGAPTAFLSLGSTVTPTGQTLTAAAFSGVFLSSLTANWTSSFPAGTTYYARLSTGAFPNSFAGNLSSDTFNASATFTSLTPNTSYYARVSTDAAGPFTSLGLTETLAALPAAGSPLFASVTASSFTVSWTSGTGANFNPSGTLYLARASTMASLSSVLASSQTVGLQAGIAGLLPNATHYVEVAAYSLNLGTWTAFVTIGSTPTNAAAPISAAPSSVNLSSITAAWGANSNSSGTTYVAQISTDNFTTVNASSSTLNAGASFSGLTPNTTYFFQVQAVGHNGSATAFVALPSTPTLAAAPASPALTAVNLSSITFAWSANGNPAGTVYRAHISTDNFATVNFASSTFNASVLFGTGGAGAALGANTTHYLRVEAINAGGVETGFTSALSTATPAATPVAAAPSGVAASSITANWGANGNPIGTAYLAQISTDSFATVNASSQTLNTNTAFLGLTANTTYYFQVRAVGHNGQATAFTALASTMTLLQAPGAAATAFTVVDLASVTVQWTSGGNGTGTTYTAQISTDNFTTVNFSSATLNLSAFFGTGGAGAALTPNTTYFFQVRAVSGGNASAFLSLGSTATLAAQPASPALTVVGLSSTAFNWSANGNPSGTSYRAQISTDGFATVNSSSATLNAAAAFAGLVPNTTYFLRVAAAGHNGQTTAFAATLTTATYAAAPTAAAAANLGTSSITANWSANANPAGTTYLVQISTDNFTTVNASSSTLNLSALFGTGGAGAALTPNTTYFFQVQAVGHNGSATAFVALPSTLTLAAAPASPALTAVNLSSITFAWSANGNPAGTVYRAHISTDNFATVNFASSTFNASVLFGTGGAGAALGANTTHYLRVEAINAGGVETGFTSALSTATPAATPVAAAPSGVAASSITANWGANGNAAGTLYQARISTDSFTTVNASSQTANTSATFTGLSADTTYYFQVRALANDGAATAFTALPSTMTLLQAPGAAGTTFTTVDLASAAVQWTSGGNGAGTTYLAQVSTDNFTTVNASSSTLNLSALFGTGGAGAALTPNTTYFFQVRSVSGGNVSAFLALGSTATLAAPPTQTVVLAVASTTVSLDWQPNGNPEPGTGYEVWRDVAASFASAVRVVTATSAYQASGLSADTTYYFKVRALNAGAVPSGFDAAVSTATLPPAPGQPGTPAGTALGVSSISWTWTAAANAASYRVYQATSPATLIASTSTLPFLHLALATNTAYGIAAGGVNATGAGPLSAAATAYTLAAPPAQTAVAVVAATSATISWSFNTNPAPTTAEVQKSTDGAAFSSAMTAAATYFVDSSLLGCTTYYYRVRNYNGDGLATAFDAVLPVVTLNTTPAPPAALAASAIGSNRIALTWTASPTEGITGYRLYYDAGTGAVDYATPLAVLTSTETAFATGVLTSSAAYAFALRARHRCGLEEAAGVFAAAASTAALSALRAAVEAPASGSRVSGNAVSVVAALTAGSIGDVRQIRFQYKPSSATAWADAAAAAPAHANPATLAPFFIHWDVTGLAAGSYDLRAVAVDVDGSTDTAPDAVTVAVDPANPTVTETLTAGKVRRRQLLYNAISNVIVAAGWDLDDPVIRIMVPAGALSASTVTATIVAGPTIATAAPSGLAAAGSAVQIDLSNAQSLLSGGLTAPMRFSYPAATANAANLVIYTLDTLAAAWSKDFASTVNTSSRTVSGSTPHFSTFVVLTGVAAASNLSGVRIYPIPYRPNGGNPDQGRPFVSGDTSSGIIFDTLPASASIKIYTLSGRLVAEFDASNATGKIQWDARNKDGRDAATGGYLAVIASPGQGSVVKRLLIIR